MADLRLLLPGRNIFGVRDAIVVTQWFNLDRGLYACDEVSIDTVGLVVDHCPILA